MVKDIFLLNNNFFILLIKDEKKLLAEKVKDLSEEKNKLKSVNKNLEIDFAILKSENEVFIERLRIIQDDGKNFLKAFPFFKFFFALDEKKLLTDKVKVLSEELKNLKNKFLTKDIKGDFSEKF